MPGLKSPLLGVGLFSDGLEQRFSYFALAAFLLCLKSFCVQLAAASKPDNDLRVTNGNS